MYIVLCFVSFQGYTQQYLDPEFYLVKDLAKEQLSESDLALVDSCLALHHEASNDTSRLIAVKAIIDNCWNDHVWPKYNQWMYDFSTAQLKKELPEAEMTIFKQGTADALNNMGYYETVLGNIDKALNCYLRSLKIDEEMGNLEGSTYTINNIGVIYNSQGNIPKALKFFHYSLKNHEKLGNKKGMVTMYNNIGGIHYKQKDPELALKYYDKSLKLSKEIGHKEGEANTYNNMGLLYKNDGKFEKARYCWEQTLKLSEEIGDKRGYSTAYSNLGTIFMREGKYDEAMELYHKGLAIREELEDKQGIAYSFHSMGVVMFKQERLKLAREYAQKGLKFANEIGYPDIIRSNAHLLKKIALKTGNYQVAYDMYALEVKMQDSLDNKEAFQATARQEAKYKYDKKKALDEAANEKLVAIEKEKKEKQQIVTYAVALLLLLVAIFLVYIFNRLKITRNQKKKIEMAHLELEEKNKEITDSIVYAKRIQSAILPPAKLVKEYLKESFILYKPKDVVAGDFYWMEHKDNKVLFAAADCTGHGVPGAMVSVVCNNGLNRAVREHGLTSPGEILAKTRDIVIEEFEKSEEDVKDGMDIALCSLEGMKLEYAGAHNPLWIIRSKRHSALDAESLKGIDQVSNDEYVLIETKANKQPIGRFDRPEPYTTHHFDLEKGDSIYVFTDGYVDQFGGEKGKKFKAKAFRELLLDIQDKPMEEQKIIIDNTFETWKGNLEQIDDVCVIGVRI